MSDQPPAKPPRVVLAALPEKYTLPGKPANATPAALDAHRQTTFLLGEELAVFERAMNGVIAAIASSKPKGPRGAAAISIGGLAFAHLTNACLLMSCGSYASCPPLVRMALESTAVQLALIRDDAEPYEEWYQRAVTQDGAAIRIDLGHSKAASVLVANESLSNLYRLLMDLSMPHFGTALLLAAPETSLQKAPLSFDDQSFHLGLAQLIGGWLLQLAACQVEAWQVAGATTDIDNVLADKSRCYVERVDDRWVFHNFRRAPSGQPKRVILG